MKRLSGWDAVLLYTETPNVHMHTLKMAVIEIGDLEGPHVRHRRVPRGHSRTAATSSTRSGISSSTFR